MSAFLVNDKHISFIITWAIDNDLLGGLTPQGWFKEFYQENIKSLRHRYSSKYVDLTYWEPDNRHRYKPVSHAIAPKKYRVEVAIAVHRFVRCWEYQSCEHDYNPNSLTWLMMKRIKTKAEEVAKLDSDAIVDSSIDNLCPWQYDPSAWKQFTNKLKENTHA